MKIKIPSKLRLGPYIYTVEISPEAGDRGARGEHLPDPCRILIDDSARLKTETFFHEFAHASDRCYGDYGMSDLQCGAIAKGLTQLFDELDIEIDWSDR